MLLDAKENEKVRALLELTLAGALWGFGFIGTVWCLRFLSPSAIIFYRFGISFIVSFLFLLISRQPWDLMKRETGLSLVPGIFLWLTLIFQTWGLQHTTATNSTFITTLYVVIVPLLRALSGTETLQWKHWLCVLLALFGTGLIVQAQKISTHNWGDLLTLICSLFAALHILVIDQRASRTQHDLAFNTFQSFWVALLGLAFFPFSDRWDLSQFDDKAWIGLLALGLGSSLIAFYFQVRAQKKISPSVVSLLFLLESPFSCFFAFWLLGEKLSPWQWIGAGLILIACGLVSLTRSPPAHSV